MEYLIQDIVDMISTDQKIEYDEAMNKFYNSEVFEKLTDKETGLYLESPDYVYDLFKDEMNFGHIVQAEIYGAYGLFSPKSLRVSQRYGIFKVYFCQNVQK